MPKIIVIGDRDSIYGFSASGLETCFVDENDDIHAKVKQLAHEEYAVIYIVESLYTAWEDRLKEYDEVKSPAIVPIPGVTGNSGIGIRNVEKLVVRAIGSDIIFGSGSGGSHG